MNNLINNDKTSTTINLNTIPCSTIPCNITYDLDLLPDCNDHNKAILKICKSNHDDFLNKANVVGIGLGHIITNGVDTGKFGIIILVTKKMPRDKINLEDLIPKTYKGYPTDVIETGEFVATTLLGRIRPVLCGYGIAPVNEAYYGTLGCVVTDGTSRYILSNNHVLANVNRVPIGTAIVQPTGGSVPADHIANLTRFIPIVFIDGTTIQSASLPISSSSSSSFISTEISPCQKSNTLKAEVYSTIPFASAEANLVPCWPNPCLLPCDNTTVPLNPDNELDAAIAEIIDDTLVTPEIAQIGFVNGLTLPQVGMTVQKTGATTENTQGTIVVIGATVNINMGSKIARFIDIVTCTRYTAGGDSGSLVLDLNRNAVGLHFAGSSTSSSFIPITKVLNTFGVTIVGVP